MGKASYPLWHGLQKVQNSMRASVFHANWLATISRSSRMIALLPDRVPNHHAARENRTGGNFTRCALSLSIWKVASCPRSELSRNIRVRNHWKLIFKGLRQSPPLDIYIKTLHWHNEQIWWISSCSRCIFGANILNPRDAMQTYLQSLISRWVYQSKREILKRIWCSYCWPCWRGWSS